MKSAIAIIATAILLCGCTTTPDGAVLDGVIPNSVTLGTRTAIDGSVQGYTTEATWVLK